MPGALTSSAALSVRTPTQISASGSWSRQSSLHTNSGASCTASTRQIRGHLLEPSNEAAAVLGRVRCGQRPLLLAAGGHVHAAIHVVEPGEIVELAVLVRLEGLVV